MMPKTNTTPETSHEDKDRSAEYTQPKISDYGDLVKVTASAVGNIINIPSGSVMSIPV